MPVLVGVKFVKSDGGCTVCEARVVRQQQARAGQMIRVDWCGRGKVGKKGVENEGVWVAREGRGCDERARRQ